MIVEAGEIFRFTQEIWFDSHKYGSSTGVYLTSGEIEIRRGIDGFYFDGSTFVSTPTWLATTVNNTDLAHYYDFAIPVSALSGDTFNIKIRLLNDPDTESIGTLLVRPAPEGSGGGGTSGVAIFDAVDFVAGIPSTFGET